MTLTRFRSLAASYGSDLLRWPEEERGGAKILLHTSEQARSYFEDARTLDEVIFKFRRRECGTGEIDQREADLANLRAAVAERISSPQHAVQHRGGGGGWTSFGALRRANPYFLGVMSLAAGGGLAIAAGLLVGWVYDSQPHSGDFIAALEAAPGRMFANEHE